MDFLKRTKEESERIEVVKKLNIVLQCSSCDFWGRQEGGLRKDGTAIFICPKCSAANIMDWKID
jgi:hypothetical protein